MKQIGFHVELHATKFGTSFSIRAQMLMWSWMMKTSSLHNVSNDSQQIKIVFPQSNDIPKRENKLPTYSIDFAAMITGFHDDHTFPHGYYFIMSDDRNSCESGEKIMAEIACLYTALLS